MTKQTIDLIAKFHADNDLTLLPGIVIGMQEEDDVSSRVPFGGSFRVLRNICAHEPNTLVEYVSARNHRDYTTHTIQASTGSCCLCMYQFITMMYYMYIMTLNSSYLLFTDGFVRLMLPTRYRAKRTFILPSIIDCSDRGRLSAFQLIQSMSNAYSGRMLEYNPEDQRKQEMYQNNPRLFWKLVVPDITDFLLSAIGCNSPLDVSIYKYLVNIVLLRDTADFVPLA